MSNFVILLLIAPFALLLVWQLTTLLRAKRCKGQMVPDTTAVDEGISRPNRVYFFHAAHCRPCRLMMPLVDHLRREHPNLIKVEVTAFPELARGFRIAATPSFITVMDDRIQEVKLGARSESCLRARLGPAT